MQCSVCKEKPATVFLTHIENDKMHKVNLCEDCAKTKGVDNPTTFSLADADLLLGLGAAQEITQTTAGVELKCPRCGFSQADFKKSGRLGCPECYQVFAEGLEGLLKTMHKGTRHTGKSPEALRQSRDNAERLKALQKKLAKAVALEDFEQAAKVRDELKELDERPPSPVKTDAIKT
jgi:protein arginine kinase activator